ncbi:MAG: hypothetical protein MUO26_01175 [Methanotrichaceae archaeon]|nr:hypothetical protein [Methanotrichaceae archaeon]
MTPAKRESRGKASLSKVEAKLNNRNKIGLILLFVSIIYIIFFINLNYSYDWDTLVRAISIKSGNTESSLGAYHFLIPFLANLFVAIGFAPLTSFKILTAIFMLVFVLGTYKFAYAENSDYLLAFLAALLILFNFGYTFLLTTLEDNIWMYAFIILFVIFLVSDRWELAALSLSLGMLVHIQTEVFIIMFFSYVLLKLDFLNMIKNQRITGTSLSKQESQLIHKFALSMAFLLVPLIAAYSWLAISKGFTLKKLIDAFLASDYKNDPRVWYFASDRSFLEQMQMAYYGYVSTFVSRFPEFLFDMPYAIYLGLLLLFILIYVAAKSFSPNLKSFCAVPTFLILFVHSLFYESYSIERWDFLPFFFMYFFVVGYTSKDKLTQNYLRSLFAILVIITATFTFISFNAITDFHAYSVNVYADELSKILDNNSVVLDATIRPTSESGGYLEYKTNGKIIFIKPDTDLEETFAAKNVYSSYATYNKLAETLQLNGKQIWTNNFNNKYSIVKLSKRE